ncbi:MAG TPA: ABC transporter ATP-binding protein [Anaerolineales bacterium]|nr:ABC transporter ATP-binding protein [Anaerolineales bacterium]
MIRADSLRRTFNHKLAIDGITFEVEAGEVFGFLGPNGAGKTTTIRILTGQLRPTSGSAWIDGHDVVTGRAKIKPLIGVVFEHQNLYERMSAWENLTFFASLYGVPNARVHEVLEHVDLIDSARAKIKTFSNGMKQRLLVARALLSRPKVLFLDEPTRGLDPASARVVRQTIRDLGDEGTTVFLTTHYMEEADQLCRRVAFICDGRLVALDTPRALKLLHGKRQLDVLLADGKRETLSLEDPAAADKLAGWVGGGQLLTAHTQEATLEEVFIRLTGRGLS